MVQSGELNPLRSSVNLKAVYTHTNIEEYFTRRTDVGHKTQVYEGYFAKQFPRASVSRSGSQNPEGARNRAAFKVRQPQRARVVLLGFDYGYRP